MSSKYDDITTAAALVAEVAAHGLSTAQEDINRAADIFGRATIEELTRLANDNGRNNEKGQPDPDGSWSSGRRGTQDTFYMIAFNVWNWRQATEFFNDYTNPITKGRRVSKLERDLENARKEHQAASDLLKSANRTTEEWAENYSALADEKAALEAEVIKLKAELYDRMTKEAKSA